MTWEVEQKFRVVDPTGLVSKLRLLEIDPLAAPVQLQIDQYFAHPARDFATTDEALRLRSVGQNNKITYKGPKIDPTTKTRREIELSLAAGDEARQQWGEMLTALGFQAVATVQKQRRLIRVKRDVHLVELAWDEVAGLGTFVELELTSNDAGLDAAKACIASLAADLKIGQPERRSYLELLLEKSQEGVIPDVTA